MDTSVTSTRSRKNYYDTDSLNEAYGDDRVDRYWEETDGQGALVRGADGEFYHRPHGAEEPRRATDDVIASFVEGEEAEDVV